MTTQALQQSEPQRELLLERFLPYRLAILSHSVSNSIATVYAKRFGLTIPEWRVIVILGRYPGLSAVEVAERTLMDKVAVSRAVTKLIKNGRIDRQFADADRRRSILNLSDKGLQVLEEIAPLALGIEDMLLDGLSKDEIRTLNTVIDRLLEKAEYIGAPLPEQPSQGV
ncbi:MAG: MarR family winged helix-turn-helix transcriptional regulator [Woeseiaceae bacterium]|nr:MarR family winged helix-turn-helix transcriptional regulator [Woeseiaceae bacterium]